MNSLKEINKVRQENSMQDFTSKFAQNNIGKGLLQDKSSTQIDLENAARSRARGTEGATTELRNTLTAGENSLD